MARRAFAVGVLVAVSWLVWGCGSSSTQPSTPTGVSGTGTLYVLVEDTPVCDVLALRVNLTAMVLGVSGSANTVTVLSSLTTVIGLDLAALRDLSTITGEAAIDAGTYNRVSMTLTPLALYVYDPSLNPPINAVVASLTTLSSPPLYTISPPLTLPSSGVGVLSVDFDLEHALQQDSQGNFTGVFDPVATVTAPLASPTTGFATLDGIDGLIETVQNTGFVSGGTTFTGAVSMQLLASPVAGAGGPTVTAAFTKATAICAQPAPPATPVSNQPCTPSPVNTILPASYGLVDGTIDANGNLNVSTFTVGPQGQPINNLLSFIGPVLSVTTDSSGNTTGFTMFVRDIEPSLSAVSLDTVVTVSLLPATTYNTYPPAPAAGSATPATNFASLPYGPSQIAAGEDVVAYGVYTLPAPVVPPGVAGPVTMAANQVNLRLQVHEGNFVSLLAVQSDDRTGAFTLYPCSTLLQQTGASSLPIYVFTSSATTFVNATGLTGLQTQPNILVKGLLFYEPQAVTVNGVTVPAGHLVMLAKQVTQLQ